MQALGQELARGLECGRVIALCGELGAGKTELVKGMAAGLGFDGVVTSPTFTLLQEYRGGRIPLFHLDCYRVEEAAELVDLGWDDLIEEGALAVEWADRFPELLPAETLMLEIETEPGGGRVVRLREWSPG
jgi:tRNA threonylcarbamoyladenosine biosynthesis protein TsaE